MSSPATGHVGECRLRQTATEGVAVGAVRYKAWKPAMAMHPTMPVHTPLVLDLFDNSLQGRALRHASIMSPIRAADYDTFPVNSNEAEARRLARFRGARPHARRLQPAA